MDVYTRYVCVPKNKIAHERCTQFTKNKKKIEAVYNLNLPNGLTS